MVFFRTRKKGGKAHTYPVLIHSGMEGGFAYYGGDTADDTCPFCDAMGTKIEGPHVHSERNPRILGEEVFHLGKILQLSKKERERMAHRDFLEKKYYDDEFHAISKDEYEARLMARLSLAARRRKSKDVSDEQIRGESVGVVVEDE
jgi:hypothetical protein